MSLNFDVSKIENYDEKYPETPDGQWNWITFAVVHRMMHTGIGWELTEENAAEFYARCRFADKLAGEVLIRDGKPSKLTVEDIRGHIGLHTNVSPETRDEFIMRYVMHDLDRWKREYEREVES